MLPAIERSKEVASVVPLFYDQDDRMDAIQERLLNSEPIPKSDQDEASGRTFYWFRLFERHYQDKTVETEQEIINLSTALNFMTLLISNHVVPLDHPDDDIGSCVELMPFFVRCAMCGRKLVSRQATKLLCTSAINCSLELIDALLGDISYHQRAAGTLESSQRALEVTCELLQCLKNSESAVIDLRATKLVHFGEAILLESFKSKLQSSDHIYAQIQLLKVLIPKSSSTGRSIYLQNFILSNFIPVLNYDVTVRSAFLAVTRSCFPTMSLGIYEVDETDAEMARRCLEFLSSNGTTFAELICDCDDAPTAHFGCSGQQRKCLYKRDVVSIILTTLRSTLASCKLIPVGSAHRPPVVKFEESCRRILCWLLKDNDEIRLRAKLFQFIFDNDASMVEVFTLHLNIVHVMGKHQVEFMLSPHEIFLEFLTGISFDTSLVVDFLTDGSTEFLTYFLQYMKIIQSCPSDLIEWCDRFYPCYRRRVKNLFVALLKSITIGVEMNMYSINLQPLQRKLRALVDALKLIKPKRKKTKH